MASTPLAIRLPAAPSIMVRRLVRPFLRRLSSGVLDVAADFKLAKQVAACDCTALDRAEFAKFRSISLTSLSTSCASCLMLSVWCAVACLGFFLVGHSQFPSGHSQTRPTISARDIAHLEQSLDSLHGRLAMIDRIPAASDPLSDLWSSAKLSGEGRVGALQANNLAVLWPIQNLS